MELCSHLSAGRHTLQLPCVEGCGGQVRSLLVLGDTRYPCVCSKSILQEIFMLEPRLLVPSYCSGSSLLFQCWVLLFGPYLRQGNNSSIHNSLISIHWRMFMKDQEVWGSRLVLSAPHQPFIAVCFLLIKNHISCRCLQKLIFCRAIWLVTECIALTENRCFFNLYPKPVDRKCTC